MGPIGFQELIFLFFVGVCLIPGILYLIALQRALERCSPQSRAMAPGQVWLLMIPLFNLVWNFIVVGNISRSLRNEFALRGVPLAEPEPAKGIGLAMSILAATSVIPVLGIATGLAGVVCWIIYWVKVSEYSGKLVTPLYVDGAGGYGSIPRP